MHIARLGTSSITTGTTSTPYPVPRIYPKFDNEINTILHTCKFALQRRTDTLATQTLAGDGSNKPLGSQCLANPCVTSGWCPSLHERTLRQPPLDRRITFVTCYSTRPASERASKLLRHLNHQYQVARIRRNRSFKAIPSIPIAKFAC
jgi:hypothetical protein